MPAQHGSVRDYKLDFEQSLGATCEPDNVFGLSYSTLAFNYLSSKKQNV